MSKIIEIIPVGSYEQASARVTVKPASMPREWMDNTQAKYAYRCLPLNIANQSGWSLYPVYDVKAICHRDDRINSEDITVLEDHGQIAKPHFGHGIMTFTLPYLFRTPPGYNLRISGAPNVFVENIQALEGSFEADWATYSFTMNWKFTAMNKIAHWTKNTPICFLQPVPRDLEDFQIKIYPDGLDSYPNKKWIDRYRRFTADRQEILDKKHRNEISPSSWSKNYFRGNYPDGTKCPIDHKTKLNLKKPE